MNEENLAQINTMLEIVVDHLNRPLNLLPFQLARAFEHALWLFNKLTVHRFHVFNFACLVEINLLDQTDSLIESILSVCLVRTKRDAEKDT